VLIRALAVAALTAGVAGSGCGGSGHGSRPTFHSVVVATLSGAGEKPRGPGGASGTARVTLNEKTLQACWRLTLKGVVDPLSAHVHRGRPGEIGPVVIPMGARFAKHGCVLAPKKTITAVGLNPSGYYVNVHTKRYLNGAVRGPLRPG